MKKHFYTFTLALALLSVCFVVLQSCGSHNKYGCPERIELGD